MSAAKDKGKDHPRAGFFGIPLILPYLKPYKGILVQMVILGVLGSLADAAYPLFNRFALDRFVAARTLQGMPLFVAVYLTVLALQAAVNFYCFYQCGRLEMLVDQDLRNKAFSHLQTLSFSYFNQNSVGYIHARVMSDTGKIGELFGWRLMDLVWELSYLVSVIAVMFTVHRGLALCVLVTVPAASAVIAFYRTRMAEANRHARELNAEITGDFNEGVSGAVSIRTLTAEQQINGKFKQDTEKMHRASMRVAGLSAALSALITMVSSTALALVLWRGGILTMEQVIGVGTLSVFVSYAAGMLETVQNIIAAFSALVAIRVNIERFSDLVSTEPDVTDSPEVVRRYGDYFHPRRENWEELKGDVEFRDVSFRYPDGDEYVLEHFSLEVPAGTNVAIVGETGAGKSTLVNLVCRFFEPTQGQVLIDGRDARERSQLWLHSHLGYVLQTPYLFTGTVRENLLYGKPDASEEEILQAVRNAGAQPLLERMENGLDSLLAEGGGSLSTGEKQLLSIARALLADPAILVLDEATSSVDTATERAVQEAIRTVIRGRTSFVIAHRLSTIVEADTIVVVEDGKIRECGTHGELLKRKGYYYELYRRQFA